MVSKEVKINNCTGLHLRPAGNLCKTALNFSSYISYNYNENIFNAKSVLSVLGSGVRAGDTITLMCEGDDEEEALSHLSNFIENELGDC